MRLLALEELDPGQLAKALSRYAIFSKTKGGINNPQAQLRAYPKRSGNTETPVAPKHKGLMGQPNNPYGTVHDKLGREPSISGSSRKPTELPTGSDDVGMTKAQRTSRPVLVDLGQPFERGLSDDPLGDAVDTIPVDKDGSDYKTRRDGPAEDPGRKRDGSLGIGRSSQGLTRFMG